MTALLFLLLCCSTAYGHEGTLDPLTEYNAIDIRKLQQEMDGKGSARWLKAESAKIEKVQDSQAYTMAYIKVALGILGFAVVSLSGLLAYVLRRLLNKNGKKENAEDG